MGKITVKTEFGPVVFENAIDAADFLVALRRRGVSVPRAQVPAKRVAPRRNSLDTTIELLEALEAAGKRGLESSALAEQLGLRGPRGLAGISVPVKAHLEAAGFPMDQIIEYDRRSDGNVWYATSRVREAIETLRTHVDGHEQEKS